jgi:glycosyltransferase involved in cell wall biosynthesis
MRGYDIVWLHRHTFWPSEVRHLRKVARLLVLDIDDPVNLSSSKMFNFALSRCLRFRATVKASDAVLAASDGLVDIARQHSDNVHFVPLCAEPDAYSMQAQPRQPGDPLRLLWIGAHSTFKYLESAREHLEAVGEQCAGVELTVVGHSNLKLQKLAVRNLKWSPATDRDELDRSHVGLVPMIRDRWTMAKAALKPLQYLSSGLPFIGSPVGVNIRLAYDGRNGILADTPADWVGAVRRLRDDEAARLSMGRQGIAYIQRYHSPEVLAARVAAVFQQLVGAARMAA